MFKDPIAAKKKNLLWLIEEKSLNSSDRSARANLNAKVANTFVHYCMTIKNYFDGLIFSLFKMQQKRTKNKSCQPA